MSLGSGKEELTPCSQDTRGVQGVQTSQVSKLSGVEEN